MNPEDELKQEPSERNALEELLAACDGSLPPADEDREWLNSPPAGRELI